MQVQASRERLTALRSRVARIRLLHHQSGKSGPAGFGVRGQDRSSRSFVSFGCYDDQN